MKKKTAVIAAVCLTVALGALILASAAGNKPFQDLSPSDVVSAAVRLVPPDKTVPIEDTAILVRLLNEVVIYREDNSYSEYDGQAAIFTLSLSDGSQKEIMAYNPFLVVDGIGYQTKYEPCEALNSYANLLLEGR